MAQCKWCGRSGFFLTVSSAGLCTNCQPLITMDLQRKSQIIKESLEIIQKTAKFDTAISRYDLLIEIFQSYIPYEQKGIQVNKASPTATVKRLIAERDNIILKGLEEEFNTAITKSKLATTSASKTSPLTKLVLLIRDYKSKTSDPNVLDNLAMKVLSVLHETQLQIHLDNAQKAEVKNQKKKALDCYYEALYFLTHDEIDDSMQKGIIDKIKRKITELGGVLPDTMLSSQV